MSRLAFGTGLIPELTIRELLPFAKIAEQKGFESFWFSETARQIRDGVTALAAVATVTKKIRLGHAILAIYIRSPAVLAETYATLDEYSNKRAIIGLGTGVKNFIEDWHGIKWSRPVATMKEYVEVIRRLLTGNPVDFDGEVLKIKGSVLAFKPVRASIPVYIGATTKRGLQMSGEIGDGVILNLFTSPQYVRNAINEIKAGAMITGRNLKKFDIAQMIVTSVDKDSKKAKQAVKPLLSWYLSHGYKTAAGLDAFNILVKQSGKAPEDVEKDFIQPILKALASKDILAATEYVPEYLVDAVTISGNPKECRNKLEEFRRAGTKLPIIWPATVSAMKPSLRVAW
jgi:5,10-methylenetetrahydromethanopterin reductase